MNKQQEIKNSDQKKIKPENGKLFFSKKAEKKFFFFMTIIMLLMGVLVKLGAI